MDVLSSLLSLANLPLIWATSVCRTILFPKTLKYNISDPCRQWIISVAVIIHKFKSRIKQSDSAKDDPPVIRNSFTHRINLITKIYKENNNILSHIHSKYIDLCCSAMMTSCLLQQPHPLSKRLLLFSFCKF